MTCLCHIVVSDAMYGSCYFGDMYGTTISVGRTYTLHARVGRAVGHHLVQAYLHDMVVAYLHAGGLKVKESDWFSKVEFHFYSS